MILMKLMHFLNSGPPGGGGGGARGARNEPERTPSRIPWKSRHVQETFKNKSKF